MRLWTSSRIARRRSTRICRRRAGRIVVLLMFVSCVTQYAEGCENRLCHCEQVVALAANVR
jgi:hypothetical protein